MGGELFSLPPIILPLPSSQQLDSPKLPTCGGGKLIQSDGDVATTITLYTTAQLLQTVT